MEKESADDRSKDTIELIVGFEALYDVLEERFDLCGGKLVRGGYGCGDEWPRERGER